MVEDSTSICWESVYNISCSWIGVLIFYALIWSRISGLMWLHDGSDKGTASVHQILCDDATFVSRVITGDESWIYSYDPETKQQSFQWKSPVSQRIRHGRPDSQFRMLLWRSKPTAWKCAKTSPRTLVKKQNKNNWLLYHDNAPFHTSFFTREFFDRNNTTTVPPTPPYSSLFPRLKIKLKGCHFDAIEVIRAESQAVLNTLTEHDYRMNLKMNNYNIC
jgi:hypothetical protein